METKKIVLIILTILIIGPLVFIGSCFPLGLFGFVSGFGGLGNEALIGSILYFVGWIIGIGLSLWVTIEVIKKIKHPERKISPALKIILGIVITVIGLLFLFILINL